MFGSPWFGDSPDLPFVCHVAPRNATQRATRNVCLTRGDVQAGPMFVSPFTVSVSCDAAIIVVYLQRTDEFGGSSWFGIEEGRSFATEVVDLVRDAVEHDVVCTTECPVPCRGVLTALLVASVHGLLFLLAAAGGGCVF